MDKEKFDYFMRWLGLCSEWQHTLINGADAPKRTDGRILNGIRNRMVYLLAQMETSEYTLEQLIQEAKSAGYEFDVTLQELPPVMNEKYMKGADDIRKKAEKAWKTYVSSEDYQYLTENICNLNRSTDIEILHRVMSEMRFVESLKSAIEKDYLPEMRRYSDIAYYMKQLKRLHEFLAMRIDYIQPFHD